jgi:ribosomal protein L7/L12
MTLTDCVLLVFVVIANGIAFSYSRRIQELERKLNLVLTQLGIDPTARVAPSSHVMSLAADPRKRIEAIKAYRVQTGAGLKEAMEVVDNVAASAVLGRTEEP